MIKGNLVHLSCNMWEDRIPSDEGDPVMPERVRARAYRPHLRFDEGLWRKIVSLMAEAGMNMVVLDLGDGVAYKSHPEIAVEGAWSTDKLRDELQASRDAGLEPIPKLNFSTTHDAWLGEYSRKVSTKEYYAVCADLIEEVVELFKEPRFFHIGMDEEDAGHQRYYAYVAFRQGTLWWHDVNFFVEQVERRGPAAWVWSDVLWNTEPAKFAENMPKSVVQSNWYYGKDFAPQDEKVRRYVEAFTQLDEMGYKQIPTGSNWSDRENYPLLVDYCKKNVAPAGLLGYLMTPWRPTLPEYEGHLVEAIEIARDAHAEAE